MGGVSKGGRDTGSIRKDVKSLLLILVLLLLIVETVVGMGGMGSGGIVLVLPKGVGCKVGVMEGVAPPPTALKSFPFDPFFV
jgi:hypothetical protein